MPLSPLAAGVTLPFLGELLILLVGSVVVAYLCYRIRLVPIAGFLIAGVVVGPNALGVVDDLELVNAMAEVGVILLLFVIGVEFSLEKLSRIARSIFVGGGLQVGLTIGVVTLLLLPFGVAWPTGIFTGCLVALSSTAIVLNLLADRGQTDTPMGRLSLAILIFQDLAIIAMVLVVPLLGGTGGSPLDALLALGEALLIVGLVLFFARKTVPWLLEKVAQTRRQELFLLTVVAICFGTAWLTSLAGVSLALGAFLAGLVVSESRYSAFALSEILPFRTLFNAVFFVSIGMLLDPAFVARHLPLLLGVAVGVLVLKVLITGASVLVLGYPLRHAAESGMTLSQIGEFSFVLAQAGLVVGLTPAGMGEAGAQTFIAVTVVLMLLTPFLMSAGPRVATLMTRTPLRHLGADEEATPEAPETVFEDHVLIVGYGPAGRRLAQVLHDTGLPFEVIELNPQLVEQAKADGVHVLSGDATRGPILEHAGIHRAKLVVIVINDGRAAERIAEMARYLNPTLQIIARTRFISDVERLQRAGADIVVPEELETSVRIFTNVLEAYLVPRDEIERHATAIRSGDYRVFRSGLHEAHLMVLQGLDEDGLHTRAVAVRPGSYVAGQTLGELALRQRFGLTVLTVRRQARTVGNPAGDFRLEPGDRLVMVGSADRFAECAPLFRTAEEPIAG